MKWTFRITILVMSMCLALSSFADGHRPKTLQRTFDPVVVSGSNCGLTGEPIPQYGLYNFKENTISPIPFQIDEKDENGKFILTKGKLKSKDTDNNRFDANDELVFMAMDSGDKLSDKALLPKNYKACSEIEVTDPATQEKAWVYLMSFNSSPENSPVDYVSYDTQSLSFATRNYSGQFNKKFLVGASKYAFEKGLGGTGEDFIDRIKVRVKIKSMGLTINRSEEDIAVEELGYIDGAVRVITYSKNKTPLVLGIPVSATKQYTYYYDTYANFAFTASFPIKPGSFRATVIDDFKDAKGWTFYNSNNPSGHIIDGKMDDSDKKLDLSPWTWSVLSKDNFSFWSVWTAPPGCPVKASQYFNDDEATKDKMEDNKGELPGIGFDFKTGWDELKEDIIELRLIHFYTKGYRKGMETDITNVHSKPLNVSSALL